MDRSAKIEALAEEYEESDETWNVDIGTAFKAGMLAGYAARDEELLAVEFNDAEAKLVATTTAKYIQNKPTFDDWFSRGAEWQHEQILLKIKGTE